MNIDKINPTNTAELNPNPENPREITDERLEMLKVSVYQFGNLSGIVFNIRSGMLCGGHQRLKVFPKDLPISITKRFEKPTKKGTVAEGYLTIDGEKFEYREVDWDSDTEIAANIAANKHGGKFDIPKLNNYLLRLDQNNFDTKLTGFTNIEVQNLIAPVKVPEINNSDANNTKEIECPECGAIFDK